MDPPVLNILDLDCVPEHRAPLKLSRGQPHDSAFAAPHPDLDELRFEVHYVQEVVYLFAIVPLVLTVFSTHSVRVWNRELLKSFLTLDNDSQIPLIPFHPYKGLTTHA